MRDGKPRVTDEGNTASSTSACRRIGDIADVVAKIRELAGVIDTGFFPTEATEAIIAGPNGIRRMKR